MGKRVSNPCKGCVHLHYITDTMPYCSYIFDTGKKRPCPPGEGCTVKLTLKKKRKQNEKT